MIDFTARQLRGFLLVADYQSFTRAADALFITPSGLSVMISQLEAQVGFRLFDRTTRHVSLTADGRELLTAARASVQQLDAAIVRIAEQAHRATRQISVGAPPLIASNIMPLAISEFQALRPDLRIRLFDSDLATILELVEHGELDMGLGFFNPSSGTRRTPFFRFSLMVARPASETAKARATIPWSALNGQTLIALRSSSPIQKVIDKQIARSKIAVHAGDVLNSLDTQLAMVEAGHGIAIIPSFGIPACRNRKLLTTRLINPIVTVDFHQIRNRTTRLPEGAEAFTAFLQSYIARWAGSAGIL
ncbi:MAG TPA: LysR family transcriptional regulator [Gemmatimonadaceae bacterium]|jgi:DNA-binding transcriptional LysR family regulator|nr:LysR family transcriptional regulator [Gemmatimonadaceae bacterium]